MMKLQPKLHWNSKMGLTLALELTAGLGHQGMILPWRWNWPLAWRAKERSLKLAAGFGRQGMILPERWN